MSDALRCPTCRAPWRSAGTCPRCGTDLTALMRVAARAWELREAARRALADGRPADALRLVVSALRLHATPRGRRLHVLALAAAGRPMEAVRAGADLLTEQDAALSPADQSRAGVDRAAPGALS